MGGRNHPHAVSAQGRIEPVLGDFVQLDEPQHCASVGTTTLSSQKDPATRHRALSSDASHERRSHFLMALCTMALLTLGAGLWLNQGRLRALIPRTRVDDLLYRAKVALRKGQLDGTAGTSARELYAAVHMVRPDDNRALQGLNEVGRAELARARTALENDRLDAANRALAVARKLLGEGGEVESLARLLSRARSASGNTARLMVQARQALRSGKLDGVDGAGVLYRRVLADQPQNSVARHGLAEVSNIFRAQAQQALVVGDQVKAREQIARLAALLPDDADLPALRARLAQIQRQQRMNAMVLRYLKQGQSALRAGHIDGTGDATALARFRAALAIDPNNAQARFGLSQVAEALVMQANAAMDASDETQARQLLDRATVLTPNLAELQMAKLRFNSQVRHASPGSDNAGNGRSVTSKVTSPQQQNNQNMGASGLPQAPTRPAPVNKAVTGVRGLPESQERGKP